MNCPVCENTTDQKYRPFCSRRCADVDLARWMSGTYAVPVAAEDEAFEALDPVEDPGRKPH